MLSITNLSKNYNGKPALKKCSLELALGQCIGIVGPNGAGKTTLFRIVADLLLPDEGEILYDGKNILGEYPIGLKKKLGIFLGTDLLIDEINAFEYLDFVASIYGVKNSKDDIDELLCFFFESSEELKKPIASYSLGMKQKVMFIASILHKPSLLILDEPFNGLDIFSIQKVIALLQKIQRKTAILISSHDLNHLEEVVSNLLVIDKGAVLFDGALEIFLSKGEGKIENSLFELIKPNASKIEEINWVKNYE